MAGGGGGGAVFGVFGARNLEVGTVEGLGRVLNGVVFGVGPRKLEDEHR